MKSMAKRCLKNQREMILIVIDTETLWSKQQNAFEPCRWIAMFGKEINFLEVLFEVILPTV